MGSKSRVRTRADVRSLAPAVEGHGVGVGSFIQSLFSEDPKSFGISVVQALAWPAAVVVIAAMFRAEIRAVMGRLVRLKYQDFEARFRRDLQESEALIDATDKAERRVFPELDVPADLSRSDRPRALIEVAWGDLCDIADRAEGPLTDAASVRFERLRRMHADVASRPDWSPSPGDAARFVELARSLIRFLQTKADGLRPPK